MANRRLFPLKIFATSALLLICVSSLLGQNPSPSSLYQEVEADFEQHRFGHAEAMLRAALTERPTDEHALEMLATVLDAEKRYGEAEPYYLQAVRLDPRSASLWNNFGNHDLAIGNLGRARQAYLRALALDPRHPNANLQLARMSVEAKRGQAALHYLAHLPTPMLHQPAVEILYAQAFHLAGSRERAEKMLTGVERQAVNDPRVEFSIGMIEVSWKDYGEAEQALARALDAAPANFEILYNLGLAAFHAGHFAHAQQALEIALSRRPTDVDTLYELARVDAAEGRNTQAIVLLVNARRLAPRRTDILALTGEVSERLGFYGDAAEAFGQYLKLRPRDDFIRRERAFALARTPQLAEAVRDLRDYVRTHPQDARGYFELGVSETVRQRDRALQDLDHAIFLNPRSTDARYARGVLLYEENNLKKSAADFDFILQRQPKNYQALDMLGQLDLQLGEPREAAKALEQAAQLAPQDREVLFHYARALLKVHRNSQAMAVFDQFKQLPPEPPRPYSGLLEYLSLPAQEQGARYMAHLQTDVKMNPADVTLRVRWAKALLTHGKNAEALETFDKILAMNPSATVLAECGDALMQHHEYPEARRFLGRAVEAGYKQNDTVLNLSIAIFHTAGPGRALAELDQVAPQNRLGDYHLVRAQFLDSMGRAQQAARELTLGLESSPTRADLYFEAALFLIKHNQLGESLHLMQQAIHRFPDSSRLLLTQAIAFGLAHQLEQSKKELAQIESRWPEWSEPYLIHALILVGQSRPSQAMPLLETAIALGCKDPVAYYNLAWAYMESVPANPPEAAKAIEIALKSEPNDPYTQSLAGRIAYAQKNYPAAVQHLSAAIRLWPDMIEAHQALSATYLALGDKQKSIAELKDVLHIQQLIRAPSQAPPPDLKKLLFAVPAPASPGF